jgi:hypothetical protein
VTAWTGAPGGVADERRLEEAGDQRRRRLDQPELQEHLDHLAADHLDVRAGDRDAVDRRQLGDHLELDRAGGQEVERGDRVGEDGPRR